MQLGIDTDLDYEFKEWLRLRPTASIYRDCIDVWAGWIGLMPRLNHQFKNDVRVNFGLGPKILWRES